jgi:UDP-N-acetylglucosamine 2-epimerase
MARKKGIPGIVIQEGMANVPKVPMDGWSLRARRKWMWGKRTPLNRIIAAIPHPLLESCAPYMFAQFTCVWGEAMKRHLVRMGREENSIFVTGSPAFDGVWHRSPLKQDRTGVVLYAQQRMNMPLEARLPFYEQIIDAVTHKLGLKLLFKLHPNSYAEAGTVEAIAQKLNTPESLFKVIDYGDSVDLLDRVDAVVLSTSTTAYHTVIAGVPLVVVDYYSDSIRFDIGETGGAAVVSRPEGLADVIRKVLTDERYRRKLYDGAGRLLKDHLFALDGRSSERVAEVVKRLAGRSRKVSSPMPPAGRYVN